jgi:HAD superfamily hydrolase (TIGR01509 family)
MVERIAVRGILFDLDDTLIPEWPPIRAGYAAVAERVWGEVSSSRIDLLQDAARAVWLEGAPAEYRQRVHFSLGEGLYGEFVASGADADELRAFVPELHRRAFEAVLPPRWRGNSPELVALWRAVRIGALAPFPETLEVLDYWRARVPLALVTNGASRLQRRKLQATGLNDYFSAVVVAEEVGVGKPDPAMFNVALDGLGRDRSEVVMVGNDRGRDVLGAADAAITPIWLRREDTPAVEPHDKGIEQIADLRQLAGLIRGHPGRRGESLSAPTAG